MFKKLVMATLVLLFAVTGVWAQSVGDYRSKATGNWNAAATWETWNGSAWVESGTPTSANGVITIRSGHAVTVTAAVTIDQTIVDQGAIVIHSASANVTLNNGDGTDLQINGTWRRTGSGVISISSGATIAVGSGGIYEHATSSSGGVIPTASWHHNSILRLANAQTSTVAISGLNQTFGIVEINRPDQNTTSEDISFNNITNEFRVISTGTGVTRFNSTMTISGSYVQSGGRITNRTDSGATNFNVGGSFTISGGEFRITNGNGSANSCTVNVDGDFRLDGSGTFIPALTSSTSGPGFLVVKGDFYIAGGSFGGFLVGTSGFYFSGSGTQTVYNNLSLSTTIAARFFYRSASGGPTGLNEVYAGTANQITINGSGTTPGSGWSEWPTSGSLLKNFTVNNPAGVTLSTNKEVNTKLTMTAGTLSLGGRTLNYGDNASLEYNGTSPQTVGPEWPSTFSRPITINSGAQVSLNASKTSFSSSLTNNGTLTTANFQLTGTVQNNGIIKSSIAAIMASGTLNHNPGSTIDYTAGLAIPASVNYKNLSLSANAATYTLGGAVTVANTLAGGNNTIQLGAYSLTINGSVTGTPTFIYNGSGTASIGGDAPEEITLASGATSIPATLTTLNVSGNAGLPNATTVESLVIPVGSSLNLNNNNLKFNDAANVTFTQGTLTSLSASESTAALYPAKINRQWTINGGLSEGTLTATFTWTEADDNNFNWTGKTPALYLGETKVASGTVGERSITASSLDLAAKGEYTIGLDGGTLPVELSSFTAMISAHGFVQLMWTTQSETNVRGFYVYRSQAQDLQMAELVSPLIAATNTSTTQSYVYLDRDIYSNGDYYYWLQNVDMDGSESFHGPILLSYNIGGAGDIPTPPLATMLSSIYPNPFNPDANISFSLAKASDVKINIYNQRGQIVRSMELGAKTIGHHSIRWNGVDANGNACGSGLYIFELQADKQSYRKKANLMK